jgi:hypothetical protein
VADDSKVVINLASGLESAEPGGATPLWNWIGDGATVFSY